MDTQTIKQIKKKGPNPTERQKSTMTEYLKKRPHVITGKFTNTFTYKEAQQSWIELSTILNSIPGANKDWKQWRKTWQDMCSRTKSKASRNKMNREGTGGGPFIEDSLSKVEDDILDIVRTVSVEGHENVQESIVEFNMAFDSQKEDENSNINNVDKVKEGCSSSIIELGPLQEICEERQETPSKKIHAKEYNIRKIPKRTPTRLKHTTAAVESYEKHLAKKLAMKEKYYEEKLKMLKEIATAKTQCASALERIAGGLENL